MLRSFVMAMAIVPAAFAQTAIGVGPTAVAPLGLYVDLDGSGNVATVYNAPQDATHPNTTWLPLNDARLAAYMQAHPVPSGITAVGVPSR